MFVVLCRVLAVAALSGRCRTLKGTYRRGPASFVLVAPAAEDHHPEKGHDEAEHGHEHHPALRVGGNHQRGRHQDPDQPAEDLRQHRRDIRQAFIKRYKHKNLLFLQCL